MIFLGPSDLAVSQELLWQASHPQNEKLIEEIVAVCKGLALGTVSSEPEEALKRAKQRCQFVSLGSDISFMVSAARNTLAKVGVK